MFKTIKLYFSNRTYYEQYKRYTKLQKKYRKKLMKLAKEFCPWSGWYMYEMMKIMLEFYNETYEAGDCCWSTEERVKKIAAQTKRALEYAQDLETYEDLSEEELIALAEKEYGFKKYLEKWEKKSGLDTKRNPALLYGVAWDYFEKKYTEGLYNIVGKHIWGWCD